MAAAGAVFGSKMGWERPNVFAPTPGAELDYSWGKPSWLPWSAAEQRATREAVAVFDQTSFSKYVVAGPGALEALQWVCAADVDVPVGHCVYTPLLNARGTYEADLTVTRDGPDSFWIVSSSATTVRDLDWLRRHGGVEGGDVTDAFAVLGVMGPASRDLLERISSDDWSEDGFPFATSRTATVAGVPLRATRMTYVGELGWELTVPVGGRGDGVRRAVRRGCGPRGQQRRLLRDRVAPAGEGLPGLPARAVARLHPGRGRAGVRHRAEGRQAVPRPRGARGAARARLAEGGPRRRLVSFVLEDPAPMLWGGELLLRDGGPAGQVTSAAWGETRRRLRRPGLPPLRRPGHAGRRWPPAASRSTSRGSGSAYGCP